MPHFCPEYEEALHSELLDRVNALAGTQESLAGIPVNQLTPRLWDILSANRSPYAIGGQITCAAILQFLWIVSTEFDAAKPAQKWIEEKALTINYFIAGSEIQSYLDRTFMDSMEGKKGVPYYPLSISLIYQMYKAFEWNRLETYDTPLRVIFLMLRPVEQSTGVPLINKRSDTIMQEAVEEIDRRIKSGEWTQADLDRLNRDNVVGGNDGR